MVSSVRNNMWSMILTSVSVDISLIHVYIRTSDIVIDRSVVFFLKTLLTIMCIIIMRVVFLGLLTNMCLMVSDWVLL